MRKTLFTQQKSIYANCSVILLLQKSSLKILCLVIHIHIRSYLLHKHMYYIQPTPYYRNNNTFRRNAIIWYLQSLVRWWLTVRLFNNTCSSAQVIYNWILWSLWLLNAKRMVKKEISSSIFLEILRKTSVRIAGLSDEIRNRSIPLRRVLELNLLIFMFIFTDR